MLFTGQTEKPGSERLPAYIQSLWYSVERINMVQKSSRSFQGKKKKSLFIPGNSYGEKKVELDLK